MSKLIILGVSGRKGSGKSTTLACIKASGSPDKSYFDFSIAGPFKRFCVDVLGLTEAQVNGTNADKESLVHHLRWENFPIREVVRGRRGPMKAREAMEYWATDIIKAACENAPSMSLMKQIHETYKSWISLEETQDFVALVDCVRFPSDVYAIQDAGGYVLRLTRDPYHSDHPAECSLDPNVFPQRNFDKILVNDEMTVEEQMAEVGPWLKEIGVL